MQSFRRYQNMRIIDRDMNIAEGDYILDGITIRTRKGYLNDTKDEEGNNLPALETHDGNHVEHWKNGVLHYEDGPAVIDVRDGVEEWWLDGKQVEACLRSTLEVMRPAMCLPTTSPTTRHRSYILTTA